MYGPWLKSYRFRKTTAADCNVLKRRMVLTVGDGMTNISPCHYQPGYLFLWSENKETTGRVFRDRTALGRFLEVDAENGVESIRGLRSFGMRPVAALMDDDEFNEVCTGSIRRVRLRHANLQDTFEASC